MNSPAGLGRAFAGTRVLVLGATGFIGRWVVRALQRRGAVVFAHGRERERLRRLFPAAELEGGIEVADLSREGRLESLLSRTRPAVTFNLVGYGVDREERDEEASFRVNSALVGKICRAVASHRDHGWHGAGLVHTGSALEYGEADGDLSEDTPPEPTTLYGRSKLAGTLRLRRFCRREGLPGLTARLFTVYGPGEHQGRLLPALLEAAEADTPLELTAGRQRRDFTYVEDVAEGLLRLAVAGTAPGGIVNLATGRLTSVRDFVLQAARILGLPEDLLRFGALPTREEEMEHEPVAVDRLESLTGWRPPTSVEAGIRETWERRR